MTLLSIAIVTTSGVTNEICLAVTLFSSLIFATATSFELTQPIPFYSRRAIRFRKYYYLKKNKYLIKQMSVEGRRGVADTETNKLRIKFHARILIPGKFS